MKPLLIILMLLPLAGCKNNDELLTEKKWVLYSEHAADTSQYYKKIEERLCFEFDKSGLLKVREHGGEQNATTTWQWSGDKQERIIIHDREFYMPKLTSNELSLVRFIGAESTMQTFKHEDDETWESDESIDDMNKIAR